MARIESIEDIKSINVHWSESSIINDALGCDDDCNIDKWVEPERLDGLIKQAAGAISSGYDKTCMTVDLKSGLVWADDCKFYISKGDSSLLDVLNKGE
jgi:hypothetical protein